MKKTYLLLLTLLLISERTLSDGLPLDEGRYTAGKVVVLTLTSAQKRTIDHFRTCHLEQSRTMNSFTPYVFSLTEQQSDFLKTERGFTPSAFAVYETHRGHNDSGPHWNIVLRFSENEIEIPIDLLLDTEESTQAHETQGWDKNNPCFPNLSRSEPNKARKPFPTGHFDSKNAPRLWNHFALR